MTLSKLFDSSILTTPVEESLEDMNAIIEAMAPEGKTLSDFTGGYLQQLKNSTQFVAYFGTKANTKNRATSKLSIPDNELDEYYLMLKAKIQEMKQAETATIVTLSLAERKAARKATKPATQNIFRQQNENT